MHLPAISVIVPVYNVENYIQNCVDSILAQTFTDFEILLLDDASDDNSLNICQALYKQHPAIRIIQREPPQNLGQSSTRNLGMHLARGKYIAFVDSDDYIAPEFLQKLYNTAETQQADIVSTSFVIPGPVKKIIHFSDRPLLLTANPTKRMEVFCQRGLSVQIWNKLYRRDFLMLHDIIFDNIRSEDELFTFLTLYYAHNYIILPDVLYYYRQTPKSIMRGTYTGKIHTIVSSSIMVMRHLEEYLQHMPLLLAQPKLCQQIRHMFLGRFLSDTIDICEQYDAQKISWEEEAHTAIAQIMGADTAWTNFYYENLIKYWQKSQLLYKENSQLKEENAQLKKRLATSPTANSQYSPSDHESISPQS